MTNLEAILRTVAQHARSIDRIFLRILMAVGRGRITVVNDAGGIQILQVKLGSGETIDNMQRVQEYGFTSVPKAGTHAIAIFIGGDRSNGAVIATNDLTARLKSLAVGEVAIYDDLGQKVHLTRNGILISSPIKIRNVAPDIEIVASNSFKWSVNGHGQRWNPTSIDTYQIGEVPGSTNPIDPPEFP